MNTVAVAVSTAVISGGIEGFVNDVGNATGLGQYLNAIINNATGWNAGTIAPPSDIAVPTDIDIWGQNSSSTETYDDYSNTGVLLGSVTLNSTNNTTSMTSISGSYALISGPTNYTQSFGNGLVIDATGDTVIVDQSTLVTVTGNDNTVNAVSGDTIDFNGTSGAVNASGTFINAAAGSNFNLSGRDNTISLDANSYLGLLSGTGETVLATDDQIVTLGGTGFNLSGSNNTISLIGSAAYLGILSGTANTVYAANETVVTLGGVSVTLVGSGNDFSGGSEVTFNLSGSSNTIALGTGSYLGLLSGTSETVLANTDQIIALGNTGFNISGSDNAISLVGGGAYLGVLSGTGENISASNDQIVTLGGVGLNVSGSDNAISLVGSNSNLDLSNGTGENISATDDQIETGSNIGLSIGGNDNSITLGANNDLNLNGTGNTVNGIAVGTSVTAGITDTIASNSDGSWTENIVNDGNPALSWTEEQFTHAADNQVVQTTVNYTNGTHTVQYWDTPGTAAWTTEIKQYNSGGQLTTQTVYNRDGSMLVSMFNYDGYTGDTMTYFYTPNGVQQAFFETNAAGDYIGGTASAAEDLLDPGAPYYGDWSAGAAGAGAGGIEIDDVFSSAYLTATATFNSAQSLTNNLGDLPIGIVTFDIIDIVDPLVINLAGQPVTTTAEGSNGVTFDMLGDGQQQATGWVTSDEGFLVFDKTAAGQIVSSHDMISDLNELTALNNGAGQITAADPLYGELAIWIPGAPGTAGQLETLSQAGITAINLASTPTDTSDNGNTINAVFSLEFNNGSTGQGADVSFAVGSAPSMQFIYGSAPNETLTAESGAAEFVLNGAATGIQTIAGFNPVLDIIDFAGGQFGSFAAIEAAISTVNGGAMINLGQGNSLLLPGVDATTLHAANFAFST